MWFREGICHDNPEGSAWEEIDLPGEVVQISCGPAELVWAVLWEGQFIVREGISRDCPRGKESAGRWRVWSLDSNLSIYNILLTTGTSWAVVDSPNPDLGATHVAVGANVVWALTKDNKVGTQ